MANPRLVSVIVPCHNGARFLAEAIESALAQTHPAIETIVVDDGSLDDTPAILERYAGRVRVLHQQNRGPSAARNAALAVAYGEYVAFLDADDRFRPEKIARQVAILDTRPDIGLVYGGWRFIDEEGRSLPGEGRPRGEGDMLPALLLGNPIHPLAAVVRRALVAEVGGFEESLRGCEEWDLFLRLSRRGMRWASLDAPLAEYRLHPAQSHGQTRMMLASAVRVLERFFADPELPPGLRAMEGRAFQAAYLRGAAECYRAGLVTDGDGAFHAAARARPEFLGEAASLRRFCRDLMPTGAQRQDVVVLHWREATRTLRRAMRRLFHRSRLEPEIAAFRGRARWAALRLTARLARKRLRSVLGVSGAAEDRDLLAPHVAP